MKVGASKVVITPDPGPYLSGFPRGRRSKGVHDDLWVRCLSLHDGRNLLSVVTSDLWAVLREDIDEIGKELNLESNEHLLLCSTHVNSSPDLLGMFGPDSRTSGTDEAYVREFRSAVVHCVTESRLSMKDVSVRIASGKPNLKIENFRTPSLVDGTGVTIYFTERGGKNVHSLTGSSVPAVLSSEENTVISCDWLDSFYSRTEQQMGGIPLFMQGSLGGIMCPIVASRTFDEADKMGNSMADYVVGNYPESVEVNASEVTTIEKTVEVPVENRLMMALSAMGTFRGQIHNRRQTKVAVVRIGPLTIAMLPGSVFPEVGYEVKTMMKSQYRAVVSFANDYVGFIIPTSKFDPTMYEERISLGRDVANVLVTEIGLHLGGH
jgi:hypothetical protein